MNTKRMTALCLLTVLVLAVSLGGCVELAGLLADLPASGPGGGNTNGNANDATPPANDNSSGTVPTVTLSLSDSVPQVSWEVELQCSIISGDSAGVLFSFEPDDRLIDINAVNGTAVFIVDEGDVGAQLTFTCSGTNSAGTGPASTPRSMFPM